MVVIPIHVLLTIAEYSIVDTRRHNEERNPVVAQLKILRGKKTKKKNIYHNADFCKCSKGFM